MSTRTHYTIEVCTDCTMMHANGEISEPAPDPLPWALMPDSDVTMGSFGPCRWECPEGECECDSIGFTWAPCEGCGSTLGGHRELFTVWGE